MIAPVRFEPNFRRITPLCVIFISLGGLLVGGCSADQKLETPPELIEPLPPAVPQDHTAVDACSQKIRDNPAYSYIRAKLGIGDGAGATEADNNSAKLSPEEVALLYKFYADAQTCRQSELNAAAQPLKVIVLAELFAEADALWAQALRGELTWSQFNQRRKEISMAGETKLAEVASNQQPDSQQRQRASRAFQEWLRQQQLIRQLQVTSAVRPRIIVCDYLGDTPLCSST